LRTSRLWTVDSSALFFKSVSYTKQS